MQITLYANQSDNNIASEGAPEYRTPFIWTHTCYAMQLQISSLARHSYERACLSPTVESPLNKLNFRLHSQCKRRLTWSPKRVDSTNQNRLARYARAHYDVFQARLPWQGIVQFYKVILFVSTETQFVIQCQVTQPPNSTERLHVDETIMRCFQAELFSRFLPSPYAVHVNLAATKPCQFMPKCKYGSPVEFVIFRVQYFLSA